MMQTLAILKYLIGKPALLQNAADQQRESKNLGENEMI